MQRSESQGTQTSSQGSVQQSQQTTPQALNEYFATMNAMSGGRLGGWTQNGTAAVAYPGDVSGRVNSLIGAAGPVAYQGDVSGRVSDLLGAAGPVAYDGVTADQIRALGGLGSTRTLSAQQAYGDRAAQLRSDPSMTLAQRQYAGGLNTRELAQTRDAISKETEAAISQMAQEEAIRNYTARAADRTAAMGGQTTALTAEQEQYARQYAAAAGDRAAQLQAQTAAMGAEQEQYARQYDARVRAADAARMDALALSEILARFMGNNSSGSSWGNSYGQNTSSSYGLGRSASNSWNQSGQFGMSAGGG